MSKRFVFSFLAASLILGSTGLTPVCAEGPFKLGAETNVQNEPPPAQAPASYAAYPTYTPPPQPKPDKHPPKPVKQPKRLEGGAMQVTQPPPVQQPAYQPPMQASIAAPGVLPGEFLGVWQVLGSRSAVNAAPQFQQGINNIFQATTADTWTIQGNPNQGYSLTSSTGVSTQISVDKVQGTTAFIRYQHPIKNTVAQEAIVMQLGPGGASFQGLEQIRIMKQGEPGPRCTVKYQLSGRRQH